MIDNRKGFTAIELIVSVSLVGMLAALAVPSINHLVLRYRVKDAAREIASSLQLLRLRAISSNYPAYLDFAPPEVSLADGFYTAFVDGNGDKNHDNPAETEATQLRFRDTLGGFKGKRLPPGVRFSAVTFSGNRAKFNPDGMAGISGTVTLANTLDDSYRVKVATITGRIKIEKWTGSTWE